MGEEPFIQPTNKEYPCFINDALHNISFDLQVV